MPDVWVSDLAIDLITISTHGRIPPETVLCFVATVPKSTNSFALSSTSITMQSIQPNTVVKETKSCSYLPLQITTAGHSLHMLASWALGTELYSDQNLQALPLQIPDVWDKTDTKGSDFCGRLETPMTEKQR